MITRALIESIEKDGKHFKVRIPILHKTADAIGGTPYEELPIATVSYTSGCRPNLLLGDTVFITFENDNFSSPVILGTLLTDNITTASIKADNIETLVNASLSSTTNIGDITYKQIQSLDGIKGNIQFQIDNISKSESANRIPDSVIDEICV